MEKKLTREDCLLLLRQAYEAQQRLPKKSDFSEEEVAMIKAFWGPWPRALEAAGVKSVNAEYLDRLQRRQEKRVRSKVRIRNYKLEERKK